MELASYYPIGSLLLGALVVTGIAGIRYAKNPALGESDSWGFYLWFTPLGYLLLTWFFVGTAKINQLPVALGGLAVYALSAILLFVPNPPPGLKWHYPIGAACLLLFFLG